ncbi:asparagine synthetase domain-containing protein 1 [Cimex lectularius]|uniref:Uncharacterized protein n=1 Tax=Cimex lectularius TaxID=79782 RepID=A0A8I6R6L2_CIMLE|nr:asparagine synthetase domain-containing protein 1 [Cimex lectularius]
MCGMFFCLISSDSNHCIDQYSCIETLIKNRGPDAYNKCIVHLTERWKVLIFSSTLWTQGLKPTPQPVKSENGSLFLWNGDIFFGPDYTDGLSDTEYLFGQIENNGIECLLKICGPYSFIYFDSKEKIIWFGRDVIGRHSLLWNLSPHDQLILTSVSVKSLQLAEVPSIGLYKIDLQQPQLTIQLHPWSHFPSTLYPDLPNSVELLNCFSHEVLGDYKTFKWIEGPSTDNSLEYFSVFSEQSPEVIYTTLLRDIQLSGMVKNVKTLLFKSIEKRILTQPKHCLGCTDLSEECSHSRTAICFSGGLDSTVIALIASKFVPPNETIDLFNVAFEKLSSGNICYDVPDRITGRESFAELKLLEPARKWNFVEINITLKELQELREKHIRDLIHPLNSILDDSLGCALWFAVRGKGIANGKPFYSNSRVVLLGMGADELFGGYSRHRKEFARGGWRALGEQLLIEVRNIGKRNLGRDNRVAADHGRQPRTPFLDERVYTYVDNLPPWFRTYLEPNVKPGIGDKFLLRLVAWDLGLRHSAFLPKRAFQFGSRIANPKEKGHLISERLN